VARLAVILAERPGCATFDVLSQVGYALERRW